MFSAPLKKRLAEYLASRYKTNIADTQVEDFLHSLADLYIAIGEEEGGRGARALARREAAPDLIYVPLNDQKLNI